MTSKPTAQCSDRNTGWDGSALNTLWCKMNRKKAHFTCTGNQEQRLSQTNCQEGHQAEGLCCRGHRKQDNGGLVLEIIPELRVLASHRISVTCRARLKWKEMIQRRKKTPLPWNTRTGVQVFLCQPPSPKPTLSVNSRLLAGMELSLNLFPAQEAAEAGKYTPWCDPKPLFLAMHSAMVLFLPRNR